MIPFRSLRKLSPCKVFRIPLEERKGQSNGSGGFGADESHKTLKAVMDKTGAKIEMSSSKDQSLTFLITGKQDVVFKARRELLNQFQVKDLDWGVCVIALSIAWRPSYHGPSSSQLCKSNF